MSARAILAVASAAILSAAGCAGGSASHATLTATQTLRRARADGFTHVMRGHAGTAWHCSATSIRLDAAAYARPGDVRSQYQVTFGDRRTPPYSDDTARIAMEVFVFRSSRDVARCARAGIYVDEHQPVPGKPTKFMAHRKFGPHTIAYGLRRADAPGSVHGETGTYDTQLADGRILALGIAYTGHDSRIVEADLTRLAHQIAG